MSSVIAWKCPCGQENEEVINSHQDRNDLDLLVCGGCREWKLIGHFAVDSGQVLIVDPCYLSSWKHGDCDLDDRSGVPKNSYDEVCRVTVPEKGIAAGEVSSLMAIASSTGYGDGMYPVFAKLDRNKRVVALYIDFE